MRHLALALVLLATACGKAASGERGSSGHSPTDGGDHSSRNSREPTSNVDQVDDDESQADGALKAPPGMSLSPDGPASGDDASVRKDPPNAGDHPQDAAVPDQPKPEDASVRPPLSPPEDAGYNPPKMDARVVLTPIDDRWCAGRLCAVDQVCCLTNGECFNPDTEPQACPVPPPTYPDEPPCGAHVHCKETELCRQTNRQMCLGPGHCVSRTNCGTGGFRCGCDGLEYDSKQQSCAARRRTSKPQAHCGEPYQYYNAVGSFTTIAFCGLDSQCPEGWLCCHWTGRCYHPAEPALCAEPPEGTNLPCISDEQCREDEYCWAESCTGPGGCRRRESENRCNVIYEPVCGCDGETYTSWQCASHAGVRVDYAGICE